MASKHRTTHSLFDHVKLKHESVSDVNGYNSRDHDDHNNNNKSVRSNSTGRGSEEGDELLSNHSEGEGSNHPDLDQDVDIIDIDLYTTKMYRIQQDWDVVVKPKQKLKSPTKSPLVINTSSRKSNEPVKNASSLKERDSEDSDPPHVHLPREVTADLHAYVSRTKNVKSQKSRNMSRATQRNRKMLEYSSVYDDKYLMTGRSPASSSDSLSSITSTPDKLSALHQLDEGHLSFKSPDANVISTSDSHVPSLNSPVSNATSKKTNNNNASIISITGTNTSAITNKKRNTSNGNNNNINNIMKNIGVKNSSSSSRRAPLAAPSPRMVRTASSQQQHSDPSTPSADKTAGPTSTTTSSSSPFIQKFDSNILRTPNRVTSSTVMGSSSQHLSTLTLTGSVLPLPSLSPQTSQQFSGAPEEDRTNLGSSVTHAIFQALFGQLGGGYTAGVSGSSGLVQEEGRSPAAPSHVPRWDDSDEEEEEPDDYCLGSDLSHCKDIDLVDEQWLTDLIKSRGNSRSNSLDFTPRDREQTSTPVKGLSKSSSSPLLSAEGSENISNFTPLLFSTAFEYALLQTSSSSCNNHASSDDNKMLRIELSPSLPSSRVLATTNSILQRYITPTLITQLVLQLPHDDERLTSPRLSVLKALYKNCPSLRTVIHQSLVVAAHSRYLRCEESRQISRQQSIDVNDASLATCCANLTGFEGRPKNNPFLFTSRSQGGGGLGKEEAPGTIIRDHDSSLVELTLFILITECSPAPSALGSPVTPVHKSSNGVPTMTNYSSSSQDQIFEVVVSVVMNVMRCYGNRLGKSASSSVEQPGILKGVFKIVEIIIDKMNQCGGAVDVILGRLLRYWPKGNNVQEVAYLKLCAHVLPRSGPDAPLEHSMSEEKTRKSGSCDYLSRALAHHSRSRVTSSSIHKTLKKIIECLSSAHFKVASQAIEVVMQLNILHPYFISNSRPWNREPFISSSTDVSACETACEALVEVLRNNRSHWHPQVRHLSEQALDNLLDYL